MVANLCMHINNRLNWHPIFRQILNENRSHGLKTATIFNTNSDCCQHRFSHSWFSGENNSFYLQNL